MKKLFAFIFVILFQHAYCTLSAGAQSIVGMWEAIEYSCWSAFPGGEDEGGVGDYLEIAADGTYYMKYVSGLEDWGTWKQDGNQVTLVVTRSSDDSISLTAVVTIGELTDEYLEWDLDYGFVKIHEKYKRIGNGAENLLIGNASVAEVRKKCDELEQDVSDFFRAFLRDHQFEGSSEKALYNAQECLEECFQIFESELESYENGDLGMKEKLENQWQWLSQAGTCLNDIRAYTYEVTITARGEGRVMFGSMQLKDETQTFCWCYGKATDATLYWLCEAFDIAAPYGTGLGGSVSIMPFAGWHVGFVMQDGEYIDKPYNVYAEGNITVEFEKDSSTGINVTPLTMPYPQYIYTLDGRKLSTQSEGVNNLKPGVYVVNGRKYRVKK